MADLMIELISRVRGSEINDICDMLDEMRTRGRLASSEVFRLAGLSLMENGSERALLLNSVLVNFCEMDMDSWKNRWMISCFYVDGVYMSKCGRYVLRREIT